MTRLPWRTGHDATGALRDMNDQADRSGEVRRQQVISDFADVIDMISRSMVQILGGELAEHGVTVLQYGALRALAAFGPALDMSSISAKTGLPASSVTSIVDRLARLGLAERHHDEHDRRRVVATITPEGTELIERVKHQELARLGRILESSSDEDLVSCLTVFRRAEERIHELYSTG